MSDDTKSPDEEIEEQPTNGQEDSIVAAESTSDAADAAEGPRPQADVLTFDPRGAMEKASELAQTEQQAIAAKLELLTNVALLTIMTLMRVIKERGASAIGPAELQQFSAVKESVEAAVAAVDSWQDMGDEDSPVDLTQLRAKLALLTRKIDEWPKDLAPQDPEDTPPS